MIDLQVYGVVTFTAAIDNSLRNLKEGKERERTMKTDFFCNAVLKVLNWIETVRRVRMCRNEKKTKQKTLNFYTNLLI